MPDITAVPTDSHGRPVAATELEDLVIERRLVHRILIWVGALVPIGGGVFAVLMYAASRMAGVGTGAPTLMGAGLGVLAGLFFGMWAGVVASVNEIEDTELPGA